MTAEIRNCEFRFKCPKDWDSLLKTHDPKVRHCNECNRRVVYCKKASELQRAIIDNDCVAVEIKQPDDEVRVYVGEVMGH